LREKNTKNPANPGNCYKEVKMNGSFRTSSSQKLEIAKKKHKNPENFGKKDKKSH